MKNLCLFCLCALLLVTGCRSAYHSDTLISIPDYPELTRTYDTSARIAVYNSIGGADSLTKNLTEAGYHVLDTSAQYQANFKGADRIVELVSYTTRRLYYHDETYLYARIIVLVRGPFRHVDGQDYPILSKTHHYFQAHARKNFGDNENIMPSHYQSVCAEAYENLMRNGAFREALETTPSLR